MLRPTNHTIGLWLMGPEPREVSFWKTVNRRPTRSYWTILPTIMTFESKMELGWKAARESMSKIFDAKPSIQSTTTAILSATDSEWSLDGGDFTAYPINPSVQDAWSEEIHGWTKISCSVRATDKEDQSEWVVQGFDQSASQ